MEQRQANSQRELARACGVALNAAQKWLAHPAWPFGQRPPWQVDKVQQWRAANLQPDNAADSDPLAELEVSPERMAKLRLVIARASKLELERAILAGGYVKRAQIEAANVARVHAIKAALLTLPRSLPPLLQGQDQPTMERTIESAIYEVLEHLATGALPSGEHGNHQSDSESAGGPPSTDT